MLDKGTCKKYQKISPESSREVESNQALYNSLPVPFGNAEYHIEKHHG